MEFTRTTAFHPALTTVETIAAHAGMPASDLEPYLYVRYADAAAEHMLTVAAGLDSMVVGEQQVIGQLRNAYTSASDNGTVGATLHDLTQRALRAGKRVHTETDVDEAGSSMVSFALDHALAELGASDMRGRSAVVVGAGAMASLASTYLGKSGVDHVTVVNRTLSRAENLAAHAREAGVSAGATSLEGLRGALAGVDVVVSATGAVGTVLGPEDVAGTQAEDPRPMVLVDLSMPRDIDDAVAAVSEDVHLLNIEELTTLAGAGAGMNRGARSSPPSSPSTWSRSGSSRSCPRSRRCVSAPPMSSTMNSPSCCDAPPASPTGTGPRSPAPYVGWSTSCCTPPRCR